MSQGYQKGKLKASITNLKKYLEQAKYILWLQN